MKREHPPIDIPEFFVDDRATKRLITAWLLHNQRFQVCCKRVSWRHASAQRIEKARRKEKWKRLAQILDIERTLIHWLAKATHHPDIYTSKKIDAPESRLRQLERAYYKNRRAAAKLTGSERKIALARRIKIVAEKRSIERTWMLALLMAVDPTAARPKPLQLHPSDLVPRKLIKASKALVAEMKG